MKDSLKKKKKKKALQNQTNTNKSKEIANVIRGEKRNYLSKVGLIIFYSLTT